MPDTFRPFFSSIQNGDQLRKGITNCCPPPFFSLNSQSKALQKGGEDALRLPSPFLRPVKKIAVIPFSLFSEFIFYTLTIIFFCFPPPFLSKFIVIHFPFPSPPFRRAMKCLTHLFPLLLLSCHTRYQGVHFIPFLPPPFPSCAVIRFLNRESDMLPPLSPFFFLRGHFRECGFFFSSLFLPARITVR